MSGSLPGSSGGKYGIPISAQGFMVVFGWIPKELTGPNPGWADSGQYKLSMSLLNVTKYNKALGFMLERGFCALGAHADWW